MFIELPSLWIAILNIIGIPVAHLSIAWLSTQLPWTVFRTKPSAARHQTLWLYEKLFRVKQWKNLLPDGAPWMGGFAKGKLESTDNEYLTRFIAETKRGEFSHWLQFFVICCFSVWNPLPATAIIVVYSTLSNFPCILNLRYTRLRILRVMRKP
jgi:glycosyl-4,4'-diaponeurosporenoate acyltransferase